MAYVVERDGTLFLVEENGSESIYTPPTTDSAMDPVSDLILTLMEQVADLSIQIAELKGVTV